MIGLLKAFGMRNGCLRRFFLWRAALVTLRGLAWGNAAGLGLCLVQKWTHLVKVGVVYGAGAGLTYRMGYSYGGTDTLSKILKQKVFKLSLIHI